MIVSKLPTVGTTIFTKMTALANEYKALNLSQGFPDYETDPQLIELVHFYMQEGANQYAPMPGIESLRNRIALKYAQTYGVHLDPVSEITVTAGGTQAIFTAIATVVHAGDEVIVFEPAYDCYAPTVELFGGKVVPVRLLAPDFQIDWEYVSTLVSKRTKLIIINNPNNPTGKVFKKADWIALTSILKNSDAYLLSDEVYEHLVFDGRLPYSALDVEELRNRTFVVASFGKLLHTTGWKVGYCVAAPDLTVDFRKIHQFNVFSVNTPIQMAISDYIKDLAIYQRLPAFFEAKRNLLSDGLVDTPFRVLPSEGTYFLNIDYSSLSLQNELDYAEYLVKMHKIATIPLSAFYKNGINQQVLRLCFAKKDETLEVALAILKGI